MELIALTLLVLMGVLILSWLFCKAAFGWSLKEFFVRILRSMIDI